MPGHDTTLQFVQSLRKGDHFLEDIQEIPTMTRTSGIVFDMGNNLVVYTCII